MIVRKNNENVNYSLFNIVKFLKKKNNDNSKLLFALYKNI